MFKKLLIGAIPALLLSCTNNDEPMTFDYSSIHIDTLWENSHYNAPYKMGSTKKPFSIIKFNNTGGMTYTVYGSPILDNENFKMIIQNGGENMIEPGIYIVDRYIITSKQRVPSKPTSVSITYTGEEGWSGDNPNFQNRQVDYSITENNGKYFVEVKTWVYLVKYNILGQMIMRYLPIDPDDVSITFNTQQSPSIIKSFDN